MSDHETFEVTCPSGLRGLVRTLLVGDVSSLANQANKKAKDPLGNLFRDVWERTIDPGIYGAEDFVKEGERIDKWERILLGDRTFLIFELRRLTYGDEFYFTIPCKACRNKINWKIDLKELEVSGLSEEALTKVQSEGIKAEFKRTLPKSGKTVGLQLLDGLAQRQVEAMQSMGQGAVSEAAVRVRLKTMEGATSPGERKKFVQNMSILDLEWLREQWTDLDIHVQETIEIECDSCGADQEILIPTDERFFSLKSARPKPEKR